MDRETLDSLDKKTLIRLILSQAEAIERLTRGVAELRADNSKLHADNARLQADNAELRAKLDLPPKTPENSSTPPSQGNKVSGDESGTSEGKRRRPHAGAHRPLHPNPTAGSTGSFPSISSIVGLRAARTSICQPTRRSPSGYSRRSRSTWCCGSSPNRRMTLRGGCFTRRKASSTSQMAD
jgi:regulator of replication initiation timing